MIDRKALEAEYAVRAELQRRRQEDPLLQYKPHAGQLPFISSVLMKKKYENWFVAANRSGKSDAGAFCGAWLARFGDDRAGFVGADGSAIQVRDRSTSGWVSSLDFPMSRDVIEPKYFNNGFVNPAAHPPLIPDREIEEWRSGDRILKLKNGSIIGFKSADSGRAKYQGTDKTWVHLDEEHPYEIYKEISIRVGTKPLSIFCTLTLLPPEGIKRSGPSYVYNEIYKPWQQGLRPHMDLFTCSIYQNPHLSRDEITRLEAVFPEGSIDRRIRLNGEILPGIGGTRAYGNFESVLHVAKQAPYNPLLPLCWCLDFNVEPMISLVGQRFLMGGQVMFRVLHELVLESGSVDEMCELFWNTIPRGYRRIDIYGDSTSKRRSHQTGTSDYTIILNHMRPWNIVTRMYVPEVNPPVPDRINAVNMALLDEQKQIHIQIDPICVELIADLETVQRDPRGGIKKTFDRSDPYVRRTHASDAFGYWISYERPVIALSRFAQERNGPARIPRPSYQRK